MPSYNLSTRQSIADINQGLKVTKANMSCAATEDVSLFTVSGDVALVGLVGVCDGAMEAAATTALIKHVVAGTDTDLSAASATLSAKAADTMLTLGATAATALVISTGEGAALFDGAPIWYLQAGTLKCTVGAATNTQTITWHLWYIPMEAGASVEAA
jgi:hypothetical protein